MKIALCHESVLPQRGGCETYIASLAHRLATDGHEVRLYACRWDADALPAGIQYHPVEVSSRLRIWRQWGFSRACRELLAGSDHDVSIGFDKVAGVDVLYPQAGVHAEAIEASLRKHGSSLLRAILRSIRWMDPAEWSFWALERSACRQAGTSLIAISDMVRGHLQKAYGVESSRLHTLPIAALPQRFEPLDRPRRRFEARRRWGLTPSRPVGLFAAMNFRLKGLDPLLRALALVDEPIELIAVGRKCGAAYARLARELGVEDKVRFVGFCPDVRDAYFAADFLVHPTFYDPCSNVVLEALACGLPVITTRYNGAAELLSRQGTDYAEGYVIDDPHDHRRLAEALRGMTDASRRERFAAEAREAAKRWTFEDHYRGLMHILAAVSDVPINTPCFEPTPQVVG